MLANEKIIFQNNEIEIDAHDLPKLKNGKTILREFLQPFDLFDCMYVTAPNGEMIVLEIVDAFKRIIKFQLKI